jgi:zinc carboxypeptidase
VPVRCILIVPRMPQYWCIRRGVPMIRRRHFALTVFAGSPALNFSAPATAQDQPSDRGESIGLEFIDTGFENASPLNWDVDGDGAINVYLTYDHERSSPNRANGHWHFRVEARPGTTQTIILNNLRNIWNGRLAEIARPGRRHTCHLSDDGKKWRAVPLEVLPDHRLKLTARIETSTLWVARTEPYRLSDLEALLSSIRANPMVEITPIGKTAEGRQLEIVRIGSDRAPNRLLLRARAHAFEAGGNWVVQGLIRKLLSGGADARKYLDQYAVYILPMANKDGVARGRTRFNLRGKDLNRNWDQPADPDLAPENHALEMWLQRMIEAGRKPHFAIDFHNDAGGKIHLSRPEPPNPEHLARMAKYVELLRQHTWFTEGATGKNFHNPGTIGEGLLSRYGIDACVHELNVDWIAGLDDYPSGKHWELLGAQLCRVYYDYFDER